MFLQLLLLLLLLIVLSLENFGFSRSWEFTAGIGPAFVDAAIKKKVQKQVHN